MRTNPNLENGHFPGQIPTRKKAIFQGEFQPENDHFPLRKIPGLENGHFPDGICKAKSGDLKFQSKKSQVWKMVIFRVGFQISNFCFEKNSTRKKAIFHPEKSHAWKKAIFQVEFFSKNFLQGWKMAKITSEIQNSMTLTWSCWKIHGLKKISPGKWPFSMHGI